MERALSWISLGVSYIISNCILQKLLHVQHINIYVQSPYLQDWVFLKKKHMEKHEQQAAKSFHHSTCSCCNINMDKVIKM